MCGRVVCVSNQNDVVHYICEVICPTVTAGDSRGRTVSSCALTYCCFPRITKLSTSASEPAPVSLPPLYFLFIFCPLCSGNSHQAQRQFTVPLNTSLTVPSCVHQCHGEHDFITQFDPFKVHSPHFLCIVGLAQAENNLDSEGSVLRFKQDKALTNFGPED